MAVATDLIVTVEDLLTHITGLERFRCEPGDVIVLSMDRPMRRDEAERLNRDVDKVFKSKGIDVPILVFDDGLRMSVVNFAALQERVDRVRSV